jgi:hypothetical protein
MVDYIPTEKAMPIRQPSTANLMIDSQDRNSVQANGNTVSFPTAGEFTIQKSASILNGFFTRVGVTEVVLDWAVPNISAATQWGSGFGNNTFSVNVTGAAANPYTLTLAPGFYTVAEVLDAMVVLLNTVGTGAFSISLQKGKYSILSTVTWYIITGGSSVVLPQQLGFSTGLGSQALFQTPGSNFVNGVNPLYNFIDLRTFVYIDFVSQDLTYNQDLKDATTNNYEKNVLCRWYFCWDNPPPLDKYGFPILPGYQKFVLRRLFSPAKQIKWQTNMPIGNLGFQVYGKLLGVNPNYQLLNKSGDPYYQDRYDWAMTLQVSES